MSMQGESRSLRFEVSKNGQHLCTSGMESYGVLTVVLSWAHRDPSKHPDRTIPNSHGWCTQADIDVGGLNSDTDEHIDWCSDSVSPGDEITVKVLEPGPFEDPGTRKADVCAAKSERQQPGMLVRIRRAVRYVATGR